MNQIRVTQVLDYFKEPWYTDWVVKVGRREANRISKQALKTGALVDTIIKASPKEENQHLPEYKKISHEASQCLKAYWKWVEVYKPESITPCERLNTTIEGVEVTGEPDIMVDDIIVDIKCSNRIDIRHWIQVNMYKYLWKVEPVFKDKRELGKVGILRLDKVSGSYEYQVKDFDSSLVDVWVGLLRAFMVFNREVLSGGSDVQEVGKIEEVA